MTRSLGKKSAVIDRSTARVRGQDCLYMYLEAWLCTVRTTRRVSLSLYLYVDGCLLCKVYGITFCHVSTL
jgi:hypothetical protein